MQLLKTILSSLFITFFFYTSNAQLVNIESKRMQQDSVRFTLKGDMFFRYSSTNGDYIMEIGSNLATQIKSKDLRKIFFFMGNYDLIRSKNQDFQNSWFLHLRYNQILTDLFRVEAFVQNQHNTLLTITSRNLIGAGIRLKLISNKNATVFFGNSYMYEKEKIEDSAQIFYNQRNNTYLSLAYAFDKPKLDFTGTVYFQPLYRYIGDYRFLCQFKAELPITHIISISTLYDYFYSRFSTGFQNDRSSSLRFGITFTI